MQYLSYIYMISCKSVYIHPWSVIYNLWNEIKKLVMHEIKLFAKARI